MQLCDASFSIRTNSLVPRTSRYLPCKKILRRFLDLYFVCKISRVAAVWHDSVVVSVIANEASGHHSAGSVRCRSVGGCAAGAFCGLFRAL